MSIDFSLYSNLLAIMRSANRKHYVSYNSSLELKRDGDLVLKNHLDGSIVWSTNTSGLSVTTMELNFNGNLQLVNDRGVVVWQSFDHPTEVWLPQQKLYAGMSLTNGDLLLSVNDSGIYAFVKANPPQMYALSSSIPMVTRPRRLEMDTDNAFLRT